MTKAVLTIAISAMVLSTSAVLAQTPAVQTKVDMSKLTCSDLSQLYVEEFVVLGAWLNGYYNAKKNNTLIDVDQLSGNAKKVALFCKNNPKVTVMEAIEKLLASPK